MTHTRTRYQHGSLTKEHRKSGPDVWVYRWREQAEDGQRVNRKQIIGTTDEYPSKSAAQHAVEGLRLDINALVTASPKNHMVAELIAHYLEVELSKLRLTAKAQSVYRYTLERVILPVWGAHRLRDVRTVAVERWLATLAYAPSTKAKVRNVFGMLFRHGMRYEWLNSNPIALVRQSTKRTAQPDVLTVDELKQLFTELPEPARTMVLVASVTGMRRGEVVGLKWADIDFGSGTIHVVRSLVDGVEGQPKTENSRRPLPLSSELASALTSLRSASDYKDPWDWVFASPAVFGKSPYWPGMVLEKHIRPAIRRLGISKRVGWHTFRRTFATLLLHNGAAVKTTQELLGHSTPGMTLGLYAQAVTEDKREAQEALSAMIAGVVPDSSRSCSHF